MKESKFKTDIKCSGCVAKVTPHLDEALGTNNWEVDLSDPSRTLKVKVETSETSVQQALAKAGYHAEAL